MAQKKKQTKKSISKKTTKKSKENKDDLLKKIDFNLNDTQKNELVELKGKLDSFKDKLLDKFDKYIMGIVLIPPQLKQEEKKEETIDLLVLIDDQDSKKMSKYELKTKIDAIVKDLARKTDKRIKAEPMLITELFEACEDGKYEILQIFGAGAPIYDGGMVGALKIAEIHKTMVLKKFEKYIVSYVLAGSLTQGKATHESDIDVFVVIDDTDVKKMTRVELKEKLRAIILSMGFEAGEMTGIKNKLNIQVYILTDFWDSIKDANPVIFTFLRYGIPLYDRGMFMPWKQLLKMGKIKPSPEAIEMFMGAGDQIKIQVKERLRGIVENIYWATLTPTQAAIMSYGLPPPTPKETIDIIKEIFVDKEKLLEKKDVDNLQTIRDSYKDLEHNPEKVWAGKEIDVIIKKAEDYLERIKKLFDEISEIKEKETIQKMSDDIITLIREILRGEGIDKIKEEEINHIFQEKLVHTGKVPQNEYTQLKEIINLRKKFSDGDLKKIDIKKTKDLMTKFIKFLIEYSQREFSRKIQSLKIYVKYEKDKVGEVIMLKQNIFLKKLIENENKIIKIDLKDYNMKESNEEELDVAVAKLKDSELHKPTLTKEVFEVLKRVYGDDMEVLIG